MGSKYINTFITFDNESSDENTEHSDLETSAGLDHRVEYQHALQQTRQFIDKGCGCKLVKGINSSGVYCSHKKINWKQIDK